MPALEIELINQLRGGNNRFRTFVETGTYYGQTIFSMEPLFDKLYTIEIKPEFYYNVKNMYRGGKIEFILGDSSNQLRSICEILETDTIFFLDGHWSAGDTGRGEKDCPLYEEIKTIHSCFKHNGIIIIDDFRMFGMGPTKGNEICSWEEINKEALIEIIKDRAVEVFHLPSSLHPEDRLVIKIKGL